jgi:hypothetical protein
MRRGQSQIGEVKLSQIGETPQPDRPRRAAPDSSPRFGVTERYLTIVKLSRLGPACWLVALVAVITSE